MSAGWALRFACQAWPQSWNLPSLLPCFSPSKPQWRHQDSPISSRLSHPGPAAASATERPPSYLTPLSTVRTQWQCLVLVLPVASAVFIQHESPPICTDHLNLPWKRLLCVFVCYIDKVPGYRREISPWGRAECPVCLQTWVAGMQPSAPSLPWTARWVCQIWRMIPSRWATNCRTWQMWRSWHAFRRRVSWIFECLVHKTSIKCF